MKLQAILQDALERDDPDSITAAVAAGANINDPILSPTSAVRAESSNDNDPGLHDPCFTALHYAAYFGKLKSLKKLLEQRADPTSRTLATGGKTALELAEERGYVDAAAILYPVSEIKVVVCLLSGEVRLRLGLSPGATIGMLREILILSGEKDHDLKFLFGGRECLDSDVLCFLPGFRNGASIHLLRQFSAKAIVAATDRLWSAIDASNMEGMACAIKTGADIHAFRDDGDGWWDHGADCVDALQHAAWQGKCDAVEFLLQHGANPKSVSSGSGLTALHYAEQSGHESIVALLRDAMS